MRRALTKMREWHRPRKAHSFPVRWWQNAVPMAPILPLVNLLFGKPWHDGAFMVIWMSFCYALGEYAYFHRFGGADADYPNLPDR